MSKLVDQLRRKFKTREAALRALGLDVSLLPPINQTTEDISMPKFSKDKEALVMSRAAAWAQGFAKARMMAHDGKRFSARDDEPDEQFELEQRAGEDDEFPKANNYPALVEKLEAMGLSEQQIEEVCRAVGKDQDMSCDSDDPDTKLRQFLEENSNLSEADIKQAIALAGKDRTDRDVAQDDPPDAAYGGLPRPGGSATKFRPDGSGNTTKELTSRPDYARTASDARSAAMALGARIVRDNSVPTQFFSAPVAQKPGRVIAADTSTKALASYDARWPNARVKIA